MLSGRFLQAASEQRAHASLRARVGDLEGGAMRLLSAQPGRLGALAAALLLAAASAGASRAGTPTYSVTALGDFGATVGPDCGFDAPHWSAANAIDNAGDVVGWSSYYRCGSTIFGALWSAGTITDLGTFPPPNDYQNSVATALNGSGQIAGRSGGFSSPFPGYPFLYDSGTMTNLGTFGCDSSCANVVGTLGGPDSAVQALNRWGQAAGFSTVDPAGPHSSNLDRDPAAKPTADLHAFVASGGAMQDLNGMIDPASGWTLLQANGINDRGQIVGIGVLAGASGPQAFLLNDVLPPSIFLVSPANRAV